MLQIDPPFLDTGIPCSLRLAGIGLTYVLLAAWIKYVVASRPLGASRVLLALPVFAVNIVCPWVFSIDGEVVQRLSTAFIFSWLCTFKVLAFCWGRPPLQDSMTVAQIAALTILPLFTRPPERSGSSGPRGRMRDSAGSSTGMASRWLAKIVLLGVVVYVVLQHGPSMPGALRHYTYAFGLYAFVGFLMDGPAALALEAMGLQVIPTFDQPWMSASLAEFWGRRWNIPTTSVLRTVVYDTVVDGSLVSPEAAAGRVPQPESSVKATPQQRAQNGRNGKGPAPAHQAPGGAAEPAAPPPEQSRERPPLVRRQWGLHATFLVSALIHEYIAWLVRPDGIVGWKWTLFFCLQAPLMTLEALCLQRLRRWGISLPRPLAICVTLILLEAVAYDLFFGFVESDTDLAARVVRQVSASYCALMAPLQPLLPAGLAVQLQPQHK